MDGALVDHGSNQEQYQNTYSGVSCLEMEGSKITQLVPDIIVIHRVYHTSYLSDSFDWFRS